MATYRFGARIYTEAEIRDIGFMHGQDDIAYYPPQDWGGPVKQRTCVQLYPPSRSEAAYQTGYRDGFRSRHTGD
jgi:hypothetical protein